MIRFLSVLISLFIIGYLIAHDTWMVTVTGFGYEITTSVLLLALALIAFLYVLHLLKKPFRLFDRYRQWSAQRRQTRKEDYLFLVLKTILDKDSNAKKQLLKKKNDFFDKKSDENYLIEALFAPTPHVFERLLRRERTELAGVHGLLAYARESGDFNAASRLLHRAAEKHAGEPWVQEMLWEVQVMQSDWNEALTTLEVLKKQGRVDKATYTERKAFILMKLGRIKEAYKLLPDHQAVALAYAEAEPQKAQSVIMNLWPKSPSYEAFQLFQKTIKDEKMEKQAKLVDKLTRQNPEHRLSVLARAQVALEQGLWGVAKELLTAYTNTYPLTQKVAQMMAEVERKGWNHEAEAKAWEAKMSQAANGSCWGCSACGHQTHAWDAVCPNCNTFGSIRYK